MLVGLLWFGLAALIIVVAGYLIVLLTGAFLPRSLTGTALLLKELRKYGVAPSELTPELVRAVVAECDKISSAGKYMPGKSQVTYFGELIERAAHNIAAISKGHAVAEIDPIVRIVRSTGFGKQTK